MNESKKNSYRKCKTNIPPPPLLGRGFTPPGWLDMPIGMGFSWVTPSAIGTLDDQEDLVVLQTWEIPFFPVTQYLRLPQGAPFHQTSLGGCLPVEILVEQVWYNLTTTWYSNLTLGESACS